jgi:hypothetical protein
MRDLLLEIIDRFMTTHKGTAYGNVKTHLPHKSKTLLELTEKQFLEEMTNIGTKESIFYPRMLAFESVNDPRRRKLHKVSLENFYSLCGT